MKKLISIGGLTATGKTELALRIAQEVKAKETHQGVDIIAADSRQVYRGLEIVSGADIPEGFERVASTDSGLTYPCFQKQNINIHGVGIVKQNQDWSVVHFQKMARQVINFSWQNKRLPIIVGGTGLYHRHLFNPKLESEVGFDREFRHQLGRFSLAQLQDKLKVTNATFFKSMNQSDRNNPRRLIRALEKELLARKRLKKSKQLPGINDDNFEHQRIGLTASISFLEKKIRARVKDRIAAGAVKEVEKLLQMPSAVLPVLSATGMAEITDYLKNDLSLPELEEKWFTRERQYLKKQITWWKQEPSFEWFNVGEPEWLEQVLAASFH